ncbi:MAG: hypothetical protein V4598_04765 [Bdellovibrionota bacterium]
MKFILLAIIFSFSALAIPLSLRNMRPDKGYMSFATEKYLKWHFRNFYFPVLNPLEKEILTHLDHWEVPGNDLFPQMLLCHREDKGSATIQTLRLWISPALRSKNDFKGNGLPEKFTPMFYERNTEKLSCVIGQKEEKVFEAWCRLPGQTGWKFHHRELIANDHLTWKNAFPLMTPDEVRITDESGVVKAISYHRAMTHVSLIPKSLLMVVRAHSQDTAFGFERLIYESDGTMSICYP